MGDLVVNISATYDSVNVAVRVGGQATIVEAIGPRLTLIGLHVSIDSILEIAIK